MHQAWLDKHQFKPGSDGTFPVNGFEGKLPVEKSAIFDNIRENVSKYEYLPLYAKPYDERTFVMICGGPSLAEHLDEIRAKSLDKDNYVVVCSNMTGAYLLENGIVPYAHFILDPKASKALDIAPGKTRKEVQYWINIACNPAVFEELKKQEIVPYAFLANFDKDGEDAKLLKDCMKFGQPGMMSIQGGTMAGLRAMNIADALGFRKMEYYGFDATVQVKDGKARPYAYEKKRGEAIIELFCDRCDARFDTTLIFQKQVNEFIQWRYNLRWMDINIIGGGLMAHYLEHTEKSEALIAAQRNPHRYTESYKEQQKLLHAAGGYGVGDQWNALLMPIFHAVAQLAKRLGPVSVLDYGSAGGNTMKAVKAKMWLPPNIANYCYDPFVAEYANEPEPADLVICTDVMEHVEPECTHAVLQHLQKLTKRLIFFSINMMPAKKFLPDGRNAHINLRSIDQWMTDIRCYFVVSEVKATEGQECMLLVGQSIDDVREVLRNGGLK